MKTARIGVVAGLLLFGSSLVSGQGQRPSPRMLPKEYRQAATEFLDAKTPPERRRELASVILEIDPDKSTTFLIASVRAETSDDVRFVLVGGLDPVLKPETRPVLEERLKDPDTRIVDLAKQKLAVASEEDALRKLRKEQDNLDDEGGRPRRGAWAVFRAALRRWNSGAPDELWLGGSERTIKTGDLVRVVVLGDFGTRGYGRFDPQETVARAIRELHRSSPFSFGITVGDNFYPTGLNTGAAVRWKLDWEQPYGSMNIPFYPSLGNHDWYGSWRSVRQQLTYTSPSWQMKEPYYRLNAGPVKLLALDTHDFGAAVREGQRAWLATQLQAAASAWSVAYGHHPFISGGSGHGRGKSRFLKIFPAREDRDIRELRNRYLHPVLEGKAQVYIAGHEHDMQLLKVGQVYQMIVGTSGRAANTYTRKLDETRVFHNRLGFGVVEASVTSLRLMFYAAPAGRPLLLSCTELTREGEGVKDAPCGTPPTQP